MNKTGLLLGILFCALSIILGAFGAHALKDKLSEYSISIYDKAVLYQMFHGLGIIIAVLISRSFDGLSLDLSIYFFIIGILLFSGSLYILSITDLQWLGIITPIGGTLLILGWIAMFIKILNLK